MLPAGHRNFRVTGGWGLCWPEFNQSETVKNSGRANADAARPAWQLLKNDQLEQRLILSAGELLQVCLLLHGLRPSQ